MKKIGFWSVFALVTGSQIGSGIFMAPSALAPYGILAISGWLVSAIGAVSLAMVFGSLCAKFPNTGGPHVYINKLFGKHLAFFTGWTYWVISWVSTTVVIVTAVGSLSPFIGDASSSVYVTLELSLLILITIVNFFGVHAAGRAEVVLTFFKFIPLLIIPVVVLFSFNSDNIQMSNVIYESPIFGSLAHTVLLTFWGFVGLEVATTPAGSVLNPSRTIPIAVVAGTMSVAALYIFNSIAIMGAVPSNLLAQSQAPYVTVVQVVFGGNLHLLISIITSIVCIGTVNAWTLTSGQIALGLANDGLLPKIFAKTNKNQAPIIALFLSAIGSAPLIIMTSSKTLAQQIIDIIDFSAISFLFVYLICTLALIKLSFQERKCSIYRLVYLSISVTFCSWVIYETQLKVLLISLSFVLTGLPLYLLWFKNKQYQK
ncbi:MAG: APC family permease [Rickettsiaceae bacterium]